jgi:outer membrane protein TolC
MLIVLIVLINISTNDTLHFTLDQAITYALDNNQEVRQLALEFEKSKAKVGMARSAFYPSISATGAYAYLSDVPVFTLDSVNIPMGQHDNYSLQVSVQQVLFAWGKLYNVYQMSHLGQEISELNLVRKKQELRYSVTEMFYHILVFGEMARLSRESLDQLKRHEDAVRKRYEAGLVPQFELLRAQVQVSNLKPKVIEAENGLKLIKEGFKMLIGAPIESELEIRGELKMTDENFDLGTLTQTALEQRIELKNLKNVEAITKLNQALARKANLPTLFAGATYERQKPFGFGGSQWGSNITYTVGFQFPLFSGFKNLYSLDTASLQLKETHLAFETLQKGIIVEVKQAYLNFLAAKEQAIAAQDNVGQAEKAFEIIDTRYKNGLATNLEYMDTQLALLQAKTGYLKALSDYITYRAKVSESIGE